MNNTDKLYEEDDWIEYITSNLESSLKLNHERFLHREKMEQRIKKIYKIKSKING